MVCLWNMGNNFFHASMNLEDSDWTYAYYQKQGILSFHTLSLKSESDTQNNTNFGYDRQEDTSCHHQSFCWHFFDLTGDCATSDMFFFTWWHDGSVHVKPWFLSTTRTLWCVLCYKASVYWGLMHDMFFAITLISYHTNNKDTLHIPGSIHWHNHINIY